MKFLSVWEPQILGASRIVTALLYTTHGCNKLLGFPLREGQDFEFPEVGSLRLISGSLELIGGPIIALGLWSRPLSFLMSGHMAFAYFLGHAPRDFYPYVNNGDASALYCFMFLLIATLGPGAWALDNKLYPEKPATA